jgi:hypothetical protein
MAFVRFTVELDCPFDGDASSSRRASEVTKPGCSRSANSFVRVMKNGEKIGCPIREEGLRPPCCWRCPRKQGCPAFCNWTAVMPKVETKNARHAISISEGDAFDILKAEVESNGWQVVPGTWTCTAPPDPKRDKIAPPT